MDNVARRIAAYLSDNNEKREVVAYGIQAFILILESIMIVIVVALITQDYSTVFRFMVFFAPIRVSVKGVHFDAAPIGGDFDFHWRSANYNYWSCSGEVYQ